MTSFRVDLFERCLPEPTNSAGPILGSGRPVHVETLPAAPAGRGAAGGGGGGASGQSRARVPAALTSLSLGP